MRIKPLLVALATACAFTTSPAFASPSVMIEPIKVELDKNWLYDLKQYRGRATVTEDDARRIGADMAASLRAEIDKAVRAQGFEVVSAPAAGVVRLSASIDDLIVNAPENTAAGTKNFSREAGRATLRAEGRDASGAVVLRSEQRSTAGDTGRLSRATDVSNRFWFDALFRDWAADLAQDLKAKTPR